MTEDLLLKNAKDSIALALQDYESPDTRRALSCIRNLYAGILLLFKAKLASKSPAGSDDVLVKAKVTPVMQPDTGTIVWKGVGSRTVDFPQIRERFDNLDIRADWHSMSQMQAYRNRIEHYFVERREGKKIPEVLALGFRVIDNFMRLELRKDPFEFFGRALWGSLISAAQTCREDREPWLACLHKYEWRSRTLKMALEDLWCTACGSGQLSVEGKTLEKATFLCKSCGAEWDYLKIVEESLQPYKSRSEYESVADGGELGLVQCPMCLHNTYVVHEQCCAYCGESAEHRCDRCGCDIPAEELSDEPYCSWCSHMMSKDE